MVVVNRTEEYEVGPDYERIDANLPVRFPTQEDAQSCLGLREGDPLLHQLSVSPYLEEMGRFTTNPNYNKAAWEFVILKRKP